MLFYNERPLKDHPIFKLSPAFRMKSTIRTAISLGGDSDTIAAITGGIAEAYYGVPDSIREKALTYLDEELLAIYHEWTDFSSESII
jgi:ADP-ribosyl-[dinitrogen reductase] hydrolase